MRSLLSYQFIEENGPLERKKDEKSLPGSAKLPLHGLHVRDASNQLITSKNRRHGEARHPPPFFLSRQGYYTIAGIEMTTSLISRGFEFRQVRRRARLIFVISRLIRIILRNRRVYGNVKFGEQ